MPAAPGVEGTMHQAASHGARRARYRLPGLPKTRLDRVSHGVWGGASRSLTVLGHGRGGVDGVPEPLAPGSPAVSTR
jgi:hypothetical protein